MRSISAVGIDLSKNVFHFHACSRSGYTVSRKKVKRALLLREVEKLPKGCTIYVEATRSAHYWSRQFEAIGRRTRQIPPQRVKAYLKSQKNDFNDAQAICEAGSRPDMRFVPMKSENQQVLQQLHRIRERLIRDRTRLVNQIRGFLAEYGIALPVGIRAVRIFLDSRGDNVPLAARPLFDSLRIELSTVDEKIKAWEKALISTAQNFPEVRRLCTIPGLGILTASAIVSSHGDFKAFRNGRHFAAWLGLVPAQFSSGGKVRLLGLTKRGNVYVRKLLVHGARAVIRFALKKTDSHSLWIQKLHSQKGTKLTAVALANKNARIAWKLLVSEEDFRADSCHGEF